MPTETVRASGASIVEDLRALTGRNSAASKQLKALESRGALAKKRGRADYQPPESSHPTSGIASPLVEKTRIEGGGRVPDRDYYPDGMTSSDGLLILPAIKTMRMTDANGAAVEFQLANPKGTV